MTAIEAYSLDSTFAGLVDVWVSRFVCPVPLVDWCEEHDMHGPAACARFGLNRAPRWRDWINKGVLCQLYPTESYMGTYWYSASISTGATPESDMAKCAYYVPKEHVGPVSCLTHTFDTPLAAILWLMDRWKV